jgi:2-dehydropantoate 2-reductase
MHYTVIGGGALGSLIAARMHHHGANIAIIEGDAQRRERLRAGVKVTGFRRGPHATPPVHDWESAPSKTDFLLLCVPPSEVEGALEQAVRRFAGHPPLLSFAGGVAQIGRAEAWPGETIFAVTNLEVRLDAAGDPETGFHNFTWLGNLEATETEMMRQAQHDLAWLAPTLTTKVIRGMIWSKAVFLCEASLPAIAGTPPRDFYQAAPQVEAAADLVREGLSVAEAAGVTPIAFDFFDPNLYAAHTPGERDTLQAWQRHAWQRHEQFRVGAPVSFSDPAGVGWSLDPRNPAQEFSGLLAELRHVSVQERVATPCLDQLAVLFDEAHQQGRSVPLEQLLAALRPRVGA